MRVTHADILMMEAFLDGELAAQDAERIQNIIEDNPQLQKLYNTLMLQKQMIKSAYLGNNKTH